MKVLLIACLYHALSRNAFLITGDPEASGDKISTVNELRTYEWRLLGREIYLRIHNYVEKVGRA